MHVLVTPAEMQAWSVQQHRAGRRVGFVPTMGALHDGHLALVACAREHADVVVVSIFVNPLQFDVRADFDLYPRPIDDDLAQCAAAGVDAVYAPTAAAMYPPGFQSSVEPGALGEHWEGAHRPGHFRGVTTVVAKLFGAVTPDVAVFGQKDAQQLAIVRQMATDLDIGVNIVALPTVREPDGLALSSRNRRLTPADRTAARCIHRGLTAALAAFDAGERSPGQLHHLVEQCIVSEPAARLEYVGVVNGRNFAPLHDPIALDDAPLVVVAAWFGEVRLIDNMPLG
ncbi:MAG: pantoate--beta-alanine ligase [Actinomycetota bacterium]